ncbi:MAG: polysaccharide deacetylase family protein [Thermoleophilia bacterium]|nr:polysaccharide deacetylase family protein [Thermoleophilia bacterium]
MFNSGRPILLERHGNRLAVLGFAGLLGLVTVFASSPASGADNEPVKAAKLSQAGKSLIVQITTSRQISLSGLSRQPDLDRPKSKYLCLEMTRFGHSVISRICLGGKHNVHHRLGVTRTNRANRIYSKDTIPASVKRSSSHKFTFKLDPADARLPHGPYSWRIVRSDGTCRANTTDCRSSFPARHLARYRMRVIETVGCTGGNGQFVTHGPRGRKRIALTFDDGPSTYTSQILHILKAHKVKATFFEIGQEVQRYPATSRRILALGHELANHTMHHGAYPGTADIRQTNHVIKSRTGFKPCLFRPPGGAVNSAVLSAARASKVKTVNWDRDTNDWQLPGSGSILNTISSARSGSIVLMHDGGGPRSQTVDALSAGISRLRHRGYKLVTVSELLGNEMIYRPR